MISASERYWPFPSPAREPNRMLVIWWWDGQEVEIPVSSFVVVPGVGIEVYQEPRSQMPEATAVISLGGVGGWYTREISSPA